MKHESLNAAANKGSKMLVATPQAEPMESLYSNPATIYRSLTIKETKIMSLDNTTRSLIHGEKKVIMKTQKEGGLV